MSVEKGVSSEGAPPQPLTASTWTEIVRGSVLVVPVGSCEQHGPHLPLDTDTRIAAFLAAALCGAVDGCIVGPTVSIGASGEHAGFPGTLSFGNDVLEGMVVELGRSAIPIPAVSAPFSGVVLVNGHGGNIAAMEAAVGTLRAEGRSVLVWHPRVADGDSHAGRTETSLLLHLDPSAVRVDRLAP
ncbi:MAG: mycofactocin biosynthesis peptidyl-dipeptidase MftE [Actinomycetes bacterium]